MFYSESDMVRRSFRSAPAQKQESSSLAMISTRVCAWRAAAASAPAPVCVSSAWMRSTSAPSSSRSLREMALRACGRFRERILMTPTFGAGAGTVVIMRVSSVVVVAAADVDGSVTVSRASLGICCCARGVCTSCCSLQAGETWYSLWNLRGPPAYVVRRGKTQSFDGRMALSHRTYRDSLDRSIILSPRASVSMGLC